MNRPRKFSPPLGGPKLSPKLRALAEWRRLDTTALDKARTTRAQPVHDLLPKVLSDLRMDTRRAETEILRVWNNLVDPILVAHAQPTGIRKGTLFVTVDSSVWLDEIVRYRRREILERLQHSFGREVVTRISFRVG